MSKSLGRPSKLTEEAVKQACTLSLQGKYPAFIRKKLGLGRNQYHTYIKTGESHIENKIESIYVDFAKAMRGLYSPRPTPTKPKVDAWDLAFENFLKLHTNREQK